ncbi:MAG: ROK family protein, partial [Lachnospiraceae bacterium]|nr:ROK family protein [Lachnospiraceae bacterium]
MATMVLDIGGTAIKSGLYTDGTLTDIQETPTEASRGSDFVVQRIKEIITSYRQHSSFDRIGISTAGQVDPVRGQIIYANENIPGYTGTRLGELMKQEFQVPTAVENDVNAAAIGEFAFGAGKDHKNFVCLTYGTGVGGAIFSDGKLYSVSSYSAGEFGAIVTHPEDRMV